jgi:capsular exopolysaccharide synthesis family protein
MPRDSEEQNISRLLGLLRRQGLWIVLCIVLAAAAAFGYSKEQTKQYTATASLAFSSSQLSQEIAGISSTSPDLLEQQADNLELLRLGDMAAKTAEIVGHGLTEERVRTSLSIAGETESGIASVSAMTTSPALSAAIASTYAQQFVLEQRAANKHYFESALALVHKQLAELSPKQRNGVSGVDLQDRAQSLELLAELQPNTVQVAQAAPVPTHPSSPKTSRNTAIGLILGLFLGVGLALLLERMDPRIRDPDELEATYRVPLLGVVAQSSALSQTAQDANKQTSLALPLAEAESFHMIRARLRSFNINRDIRLVMVSSAAPGEGKTTVARHLAAAAARMGSQVLLLEAELRHPTLARQLDIESSAGLPDVLSGSVPMQAAIRSVGSQAEPDHGAGSQALDVLPSGPSSPLNTVEMIESPAMAALLAQVRSSYDLVVIDAPELTAVSDAFLLLAKVDGVIIVGHLGHSRRDVAEHLRHVLDSSGAPLLGVIANGVKQRGRNSNASAGGSARADQPPARALVNEATAGTPSLLRGQ